MAYFEAKMHQILFRLGLRPRPRWESLQHSPHSIAGSQGPTSKEKEGERRGYRREKGEGSGWNGSEGKKKEGGSRRPISKGRGREGDERENEGRKGRDETSLPIRISFTHPWRR